MSYIFPLTSDILLRAPRSGLLHVFTAVVLEEGAGGYRAVDFVHLTPARESSSQFGSPLALRSVEAAVEGDGFHGGGGGEGQRGAEPKKPKKGAAAMPLPLHIKIGL